MYPFFNRKQTIQKYIVGCSRFLFQSKTPSILFSPGNGRTLTESILFFGPLSNYQINYIPTRGADYKTNSIQFTSSPIHFHSEVGIILLISSCGSQKELPTLLFA